VCILRGGIIGGLKDLYGWTLGWRTKYRGLSEPAVEPAREEKAAETPVVREPSRAAWRRASDSPSGPILQASGLTKRYGGLLANSDIDFTVHRGELRGIIGPNGAGKSTCVKMLTCEIPPTSGTIVFHGRDVTGMHI